MAVHRECRSDRPRSIGRAKQRQPIGAIARQEALNLTLLSPQRGTRPFNELIVGLL